MGRTIILGVRPCCLSGWAGWSAEWLVVAGESMTRSRRTFPVTALITLTSRSFTLPRVGVCAQYVPRFCAGSSVYEVAICLRSALVCHDLIDDIPAEQRVAVSAPLAGVCSALRCRPGAVVAAQEKK